MIEVLKFISVFLKLYLYVFYMVSKIKKNNEIKY